MGTYSSIGASVAALLPLILLGGNILPNLLHTFFTLDVMRDRIKFMHFDAEDTFDYIVVGGGSAGCVVSSRLSEDRNVNVLLLEAGGTPNPLHEIPLLTVPLLNRPHVDWRYSTVPQAKACLAMNNQSCAWPRGRSLGGSSNLNFMIYVRGFPRDYDNWANMTSDDRWAYQNVLPFFKKSENYHGEWDNEKYHGHGGPLNVAAPRYQGMSEIFVKAGQEFGYPRSDPTGEFKGEGFSPIYSTQKNGRRHSAYKAFIHPVRRRANLFIYKFSHVTQILFEGPENRAVGVKYLRHGQEKVARAKKEVILSAGALNTPQILMLSGIGPKKHLEAFEIPVLSDLPVGQNLQDHISTLIPFIVTSPISLRLDRDVTLKSIQNFFQNGLGPLTSSSAQATAFLPSTPAKNRGHTTWPDIQYVLVGTGLGTAYESELTRSGNFREGILKKFFSQANENGRDSFQIMNILNRPSSRGQLTLQSTDPLQPLNMDPNYLDHEDDMEVLVEGAKKIVQIIEQSKTFKAIGGKLIDTPFPGCENYTFRTDQYWQCYHRHYSLTVWHQCCTASMGIEGSKVAVVDSQLRVIGTKNLRVVDASIMPTIVSGNTNGPVYMIAEVGANLIKEAMANGS